MVLTVLLILCLISFDADVYAVLLEGSSCTIRADGSTGTCKYISECPYAKAKSSIEDLCNFNGSAVIVCCKEDVFQKMYRNVGQFNPPPAPGYAQPVNTISASILNNPFLKQHFAATPPTQYTAQYKPQFTTQPTVQFLKQSGTRRIGDMSKSMCKKYAFYAREIKLADTLSARTVYTNVLDCPYEKEQLISGGKLASRKEFPHMAQIGYRPKEEVEEIAWRCGGSLISEKFILTAAHCLDDRSYGVAKFVRLGITNATDTDHLQEASVKYRIPHPEYANEKYHDIGLIELVEALVLNNFVRPACLYTQKEIPNSKAIASGWGSMILHGEQSKNLLKVVLDFFDDSRCNNSYRSYIASIGSKLQRGILDETMICAGSFTDMKKDACEGDSGGPLQIYHEETEDIKCMYNIVGVTSFGKGCGLSVNHPGVYTRVSRYVQWIEDRVWKQQ